MKTLILAAIRCSLIFTAVAASVFSIRPAQGGYIVTLHQVGSNVVANGSGAFNLTGLTLMTSTPFVSGSAVRASEGVIAFVPSAAFGTIYTGLTGTKEFRERGTVFANLTSGDLVILQDAIEPGFYREIINSDRETYGGSNVGNFGGVQSEAREWMGREHSILIHLPPLATVALKLEK